MKILVACLLIGVLVGFHFTTGDGIYVLPQIVVIGCTAVATAIALAFVGLIFVGFITHKFPYFKVVGWLVPCMFICLFGLNWQTKYKTLRKPSYPKTIGMTWVNVTDNSHGRVYVPDVGAYASSAQRKANRVLWPE